MSLTRDHNDIVFECDTCNELLETGTSSWESARNILHRNDWRPYKVKEAWLHRCNECAWKHEQEQRKRA